MPQFIIQHEGVYNIWSTVVDAPLLKPGVTREGLIEEIESRNAMMDLDKRLARADAFGSSCLQGRSLARLTRSNRAGPNEGSVSLETIIREYLTLPKEYA